MQTGKSRQEYYCKNLVIHSTSPSIYIPYCILSLFTNATNDIRVLFGFLSALPWFTGLTCIFSLPYAVPFQPSSHPVFHSSPSHNTTTVLFYFTLRSDASIQWALAGQRNLRPQTKFEIRVLFFVCSCFRGWRFLFFIYFIDIFTCLFDFN